MLWLAVALALPTAGITVDVTRTLGPVNRGVLGNNLVDYQKLGYGDTSPQATDEGEAMWDPVRKEPVPAMVALAKEAGMSIARWPGGCASHLYEWKRTIGPLSQRPHQLFGLPEYLKTCRAIGAQPLITVAEYFGTAKDAADLVEYLNAPNDGRHPWAAKRVADGHPESWHVKWFEFGNESDHGPHRGNDDIGKLPAFSGEEYARRYLAYRASMRAVDSSIRLGAVVSTGLQNLDGWPRKVAIGVGASMDFAIFHSYLPSVNQENKEPGPLFENSLAGEDQVQDYLDSLRAMLAKATGRPAGGPKSTPIAVTEFNGGFVQEKPVPYRHCLGNALVVADMIHVWMRPRNDVIFANFWEFPNEYWGMVRGYPTHGEPAVRRPQFYAAQFFAERFGTVLLGAAVQCPTYSVAGDNSIGIEPHAGQGSRGVDLETISLGAGWSVTQVDKVEQHIEDGVLRVQFNDPGDLNYYHALLQTKALPNASYRLSGWVKTEGMPAGNGACFQVGDGRGWVETHSAQITPWVTGTTGWRRVDVVYATLPDTKTIQVVARRLSGTGPVLGTAWYKNLTLTRIVPKSFAAVPVLSVSASRDTNGHKVFLIVTNKDLRRSVATRLSILGLKGLTYRAWSLTGPSVDSTNEQVADRVRVRPLSVDHGVVVFPACSLTAVEISGSKG